MIEGPLLPAIRESNARMRLAVVTVKRFWLDTDGEPVTIGGFQKYIDSLSSHFREIIVGAPLEKVILVILAFIIAIAGTLYLITLQRKLSEHGNKLVTMMDHFSEVPRETLLDPPPDYTSRRYYFLTIVRSKKIASSTTKPSKA